VVIVVDIFEADEKQREEEIQQWWKDNWVSIIGGITIAIIGIIAFWSWRDYQMSQKQIQTASLYSVISNTTDVKIDDIKSYIDSNKNEYGQIVSFQLANLYVAEGKYQEAFNTLVDNIQDGIVSDSILNDVAKVRAARLAIELKKFNDSVALLDKVENESFKATVLELKGDNAKAQGKNEEALDFYNKAVELYESINTNIVLKLKRDSLLTTDGVVNSNFAKTQEKTEVKTEEVKAENLSYAPVENSTESKVN
jgi:predicted negative regulator of RcsB-dependent stress response